MYPPLLSARALRVWAALATVIVLLAASSCASLSNSGGYSAWKLTDPPQNSPYQMPLQPRRMQAHEVQRFVQPPPQWYLPGQRPQWPPQPPRPPQTLPGLRPPQSAAPSPAQPQRSDRPPATESSPLETEQKIRQRLDAPAPGAGPNLFPQSPGSTPDRTPLHLDLKAPSTAQQGDLLTFEIALANPGAGGVEDVTVDCEFTSGLSFPGSTETRVRQPLGSLAAGATRTLPLQLEVVGVDEQCVTVTLTAADREPVTQRACVTCTAAAVELQIVGPTERRVGQRAEFIMTVVNRGDEDLPQMQVTLEHSDALVTREASAGVRRSGAGVHWDLGTLLARERVQIQVELECLHEATDARLTFGWTSAISTGQRPAALRILGRTSPLTLSLGDSVDPVSVGEAFQYRIELANAGAATISDAVLDLEIPDAFEVSEVRLIDGSGTRPLLPDRTGPRMSIANLPPLEPQSNLSLILAGRAIREGRLDLTATLRSTAAAESVQISEPTVVNPPVTQPSAAATDPRRGPR